MKSLYQISKEATELASALIEGELTPEMETALTINQNELQEKAINYGYAIRSIESDVNIIEDEIKRLQALKTSRTNAIERMKATVLEAMQIYGIEKVASPTLNLAVRLNPESVDLVNEYQIPDCYKKEKVTISIDKVMIKEDLRSGLEVPGAVLKRTQRLEIK
jgi:hypothetical protein